MRERIEDAVRKAIAGSRMVQVTFKPDATAETTRMLELDKDGCVLLTRADRVNLSAVAGSRWGTRDTRTITVELTTTFDEGVFIEQMNDALEAISVID